MLKVNGEITENPYVFGQRRLDIKSERLWILSLVSQVIVII